MPGFSISAIITRVKFCQGILAASFSTAQAARLTGLSARQLDYWDRQGFLHPSLEQARGYGSARRYSFRDVVRLRVAGRLRAGGFGLKRIRECVKTLERLDPSRAGIEDARLVILGASVVWVRTETELVDLLHQGQLMLVFPVGDAVVDMARAAQVLFEEPRPELFEPAERPLKPEKRKAARG